MTVSTEINHEEYVGNGITYVFPYRFRIFKASNMAVVSVDANGVEKNLVLNTDFTLSGVGAYTGGNVTLTNPLPSGWGLTLTRELKAIQETDLRNQGTFFAETHEDAFDYLTMLIQQVGSWFTLALRKPTFLSNFYDAKQNRIVNLADPVGTQDAVNNRSMRSYVEQMVAGVAGGFGWFLQEGVGAVPRTFQDKMRDNISVKDFGAIGDGITNDDAAFNLIESSITGKYIDLCGLTYSVTAAFTGNKYGNGTFKRADGQLIPALYHSTQIRSGRYIQAIGQDALHSIPELPNSSFGTNLIAIGPRALYKAVNIKNNYAFGYQALYSLENGVYNSAFGFESMIYTNGDGDGITGSRNSAFGDNTMRFNTTGYNNIAFGRNAGQTGTTGSNTIHFGVASGAGDCPVDLSGNIINTFPTAKTNCVALGTSTLFYTSSSGHTAIGSESLQYLKHGLQNTAVGYLAGKNLEANVSPTGKMMVTVTATGTYIVSGSLITVTQSAHGFSTGDTVKIKFTSGPINEITSDYLWLAISVFDVNTYTISAPSTVPSGNGATIVAAKYNTVNSTVQCDFNTIVGYNALSLGSVATHATAIGSGALTTGGKADNTAVGFRTLAFLGEEGNQIRNTAIGTRAMEFMIDGSQCTDVFNSSAIGYQAYVSGNSQVQLGNSSTTPYAYNALQLRSDIHDKFNVKDTELGIEFILGLRPVQGNWNVRESYLDEYEVQIGIDEDANPIFETRLKFDEEGHKAGTRARGRDHNWFIAQEVDELCQSLHIDFAGLQNHSRNGGCDVFSLGYEEFIPPLTKAVQQCWARIDELELRISAIEKK